MRNTSRLMVKTVMELAAVRLLVRRFFPCVHCLSQERRTFVLVPFLVKTPVSVKKLPDSCITK